MDLHFEGLYLIQVRECKTDNNEVYKIGRSKNLAKRIYQYPNGSIAYLIIECQDSKKHETELIKLFTSKYKLKRFYGNEYFMGNLDIMKQDIIKYVNLLYNNVKIVNEPIKIYRYNEDDVYVLPSERDIKKININVITYMEDRTCNRCKKKFDFPCQLERHNNSTRKCKIKNNNNICSHCNITCSSKYNLERHYKTCKKKQESNTVQVYNNDGANIIAQQNNVVEEENNNTDNSETIKTLSSTLSKLIKKNTNNIHKDSIKELSNCLETLVSDI